MGREAFAARLGDVLARDGVVPMDGTAPRLLDRVSAVLIDSRVLCAGRPRLLSVTTVGDLGEAEAWSAAQSVLDRRTLRELSGEDPLVGGPSSALFGSDLGRTLAVRGSATALGAAAAWQCGRMTGRARRASTMGLAALVGTQLGQTYLTDWHSPLVLITSVASAATLFAIVETPVVSHFFGCTPLGPMAWSIVGGCSAAATVGAALAPRLLFPRRVPLAV